MKTILLQTLIISYGIVGILNVVAYVPTIRDLYKHKKKSANIHSYMLWTITTGVTTLYSYFILDDFLFRVVSSLNFVSCFFILVLSVRLNQKMGG